MVGCLSRYAKAEAFAPGGGSGPPRDKPGAPNQGATYDAAGRRAGPDRGAPDGSTVGATPSTFLRVISPSLRAVSLCWRLRVEHPERRAADEPDQRCRRPDAGAGA